MNLHVDMSLKAGAAQTDITPPLGTRIGVDLFGHYARFIHDKLYAKSLILQQGELVIAFVVLDICIMPTDLMQAIKLSIKTATGIPQTHVMLSCTHTHGAGDVAGLLGGAVDIAYRSRLPELVASSVAKALARIESVQISYGVVSIPQHVVSRRYKMDASCRVINPVTGKKEDVKMNPVGEETMIVDRCGEVDPQLSFIALKTYDDLFISVLANYGLHYVGDWDVDTITADYYGAFADKIKTKLDASDQFVGIMTHGTAGNVNIWDFLNPDRYPNEPHAKTDLIAEDLADAVVAQMEDLTYESQVNLALKYLELDLPIRKPSDRSLAASGKLLRKYGFDNIVHDEHGLAMIYAREQLLLNEYPDVHRAALQGIQIGNMKIGALGGEIFAETGLWLKEQFLENRYFTICLANTYDGYVPPAHEHARGGYETWRARSSFLAENSEERIRQELVTLLKELT